MPFPLLNKVNMNMGMHGGGVFASSMVKILSRRVRSKTLPWWDTTPPWRFKMYNLVANCYLEHGYHPNMNDTSIFLEVDC